jgi:hypothetical protein
MTGPSGRSYWEEGEYLPVTAAEYPPVTATNARGQWTEARG